MVVVVVSGRLDDLLRSPTTTGASPGSASSSVTEDPDQTCPSSNNNNNVNIVSPGPVEKQATEKSNNNDKIDDDDDEEDPKQSSDSSDVDEDDGDKKLTKKEETMDGVNYEKFPYTEDDFDHYYLYVKARREWNENRMKQLGLVEAASKASSSLRMARLRQQRGQKRKSDDETLVQRSTRPQRRASRQQLFPDSTPRRSGRLSQTTNIKLVSLRAADLSYSSDVEEERPKRGSSTPRKQHKTKMMTAEERFALDDELNHYLELAEEGLTGKDAKLPKMPSRMIHNFELSENDKKILSKIPTEVWMTHFVKHLFRGVSISNFCHTVSHAHRLVYGKGMTYSYWGDGVIYGKNQCISLADDLESLHSHAREFSHKHGDPSNGWTLTHPLNKLRIFQAFAVKQGIFH